MRTFLKIIGALLLLILIAAFFIPIIYKKEILNVVKTTANKSINGHFDFKDLDISLFTHFPKLNVRMTDALLDSYVNNDTTHLFNARSLSIDLNLWNVISKTEKLDIKALYVDQANINMKGYTNHKTNLDLLPASESTNTSSSNSLLKLSHYELNDCNISFIDSSSQLLIKHLNHAGSIDLNGDLATIETKTNIDSLNYNSSGMTYLRNVKLNSILNLTYDQKDKLLLLKNNELSINDLKLILEGSIKTLTEDTELDLKFKAPGNQFKDLFSLIPSSYTKDYKNAKSEGSFNLNSWVKGRYNAEKKIFPNWNLDCKVKDGGIQYQGMPVKLNGVVLDLTSTNQSEDLSNMNLKINPFSFNLNNNPFNGKILIDQVKTNPHVISNVNGKINLSDFKNFIPLDPGVNLSGLIDAKLETEFVESQINAGDYAQVSLNGFLNLKDVIYKNPTIPQVKINNAEINFTPHNANFNQVQLNLGKSDMLIQGTLIDPLNFVNDKQKVQGNFNISGKLFDSNEWLTDDASSNSPTIEPSSVPGLAKRMDLTLSGVYDQIKYDVYQIENVKMNGKFTEDHLNLSNYSMRVNTNDISGTCNLEEMMQYVYNNKTLNGTIKIASNAMDLDKLMGSKTVNTSSQTTEEPFLVPKGMNLKIEFVSKSMKYDKLNLNDVKSEIYVVNDEIQIKDLSSSAMGGKMALSGIYNSANPTKPIFDMKYDLQKIQFPKIFESIKCFKLIAPIAQFLEGQFNSSFVFSGSMLKDMSPDLNSINIGGILETIDASIKNYKPLESISNKLNIKEFKNLSLKNTKNWFTVENGRVDVKDLKYKLSDMDININGHSNIQGPMEYALKFKIPRNKLNQNAVGQATETGIQFIKNLGSKAGVNIEQGAFVNVLVSLSGKLLDPEIKFKLLGSDGQSLEEQSKDVVNAAVDKAKDSLRTRAGAEVEKAKEKILLEEKRVEDSLKKVAAKKIDEEKNKVLDKAAEEAKKKIDSNLVNKAKDVLKDKVGKGAEDILKDTSINKIKDKMKDWNPFKKKG